MALVALITAGLYIARSTTGDGCDDGVVLRLAVAPDVSPLIERAANTDGGCPNVSLTPLEAGQTSAILADGSLDGWVPASSGWLHLTPTPPPEASPPASPEERPPETGTPAPGTPGSMPDVGTAGSRAGVAPVSLVRTPLVIAAPRPLAEALGWPEQQATWAELTAAVAAGRIPRFSMENPVRTPTGMLAVLGVHSAMSETTPDPGLAQMRALTLRSRLSDADAEAAALLRALATMADPDQAVREVGAFPVTEQALWTYQSGEPAVPLVAIYPPDGLVEADYPLALTPAAAADSARRGLADQLIARIHSAGFAAAVAEYGFRPASGAPVAPSAVGLLEQYPEPTTIPADPALITIWAHQWAGYVQRAFQTLVLVDASASMNDPVRDRDGNLTTKAELLRAAGVQAAELFGLDTSLGMWMFATPAPTSPPYVEVVPFGPLDEPIDGVPRRELVRSASESYRPFDRAGTPLYETVLQGVAAMQPLVKPEAVTLVVVLTDGREEDTAYAMSRPDFLSRLRAMRDPDRPVPVFCLGYGADADMAALNDIAEATGGRAVASNDPGDLASAIGQIFLAAHGVR